MTLRRKMAYQIAAMIIGLALVGGASLWGIVGLHSDFSSAIRGYQELRRAYEQSLHVSMEGYEELRGVYEVSSDIQVARILLNLDKPDVDGALREIANAEGLFRQSFSSQSLAGAGTPKQILLKTVMTDLAEANGLRTRIITQRPADAPAMLGGPINRILAAVSNLAAEIRREIAASESSAEKMRQESVSAMNAAQHAADHRRRATILVMSALVAIIIAAAIALGILEYRSVTRPLAKLGEGVRRIAEGDLSQRVEPAGHAEFVALARDFNRMANELDELYRELEQKVAQKSKQLVRSERLASVGFLAAGVAHEINNPIGIIAGYAEFALEQLRKDPGEKTLSEAVKALTTICEEAFRCKEIVQKLLTLARPGEEARAVIALSDVAASVVSTVGGLKDYRDRKLTLDARPGEGLDVLANEGEMKQVILNLALNALEATEPGWGRVEIRIHRADRFVELIVQDNGRGMGPDVLEHVFEPFFTAKRGAMRPGTGLGLSIVNAIVENHGGEISAHSDGVGKGSRFTVRLPAADSRR